jgi:hypothetical protein
MKKLILGGAIVLFALLAFSGSASAQAVGPVNCGPTVGYGDVCPDDIERPVPDVEPAAVAALPRTGSDSSMPLARTAVVLIGVGAAMTILANRHRLQRVPA